MEYHNSISPEEAKAFDEVAERSAELANQHGRPGVLDPDKNELVVRFGEGIPHGKFSETPGQIIPARFAISGIREGDTSLIQVGSRDGWNSVGWERRSGVMFKVPGIALDPNSPEAYLPLAQSSGEGFPANDILIQKRDLGVNVQTRGDHSQFNYHRGLRPSARPKSRPGYGRIDSCGNDYTLVSPKTAKGLERQIVQGTLSTVSLMLDDWSAAAGIEIRPWSPEVMDVRALVEERVKEQLAREPKVPGAFRFIKGKRLGGERA